MQGLAAPASRATRGLFQFQAKWQEVSFEELSGEPYLVILSYPSLATAMLGCGEGNGEGQGSLVGCHLWGRTVGHRGSNLAAAACWDDQPYLQRSLGYQVF